MKKLISIRITVLTVLLVSLLGCNSSKSQIYTMVDELNKDLPMSLGVIGDFTSVSISNGYLNMVMSVNEDVVNIDALKKSPELLHENLVQIYTNSTDSSINAVIKELKNSKLGFRLTYIGKTSGKSVSATLTNEEIRQISSTPASQKNPIELLNSQINTTNAQLPMDLGNGMIMYKMGLEGGYVVWYYRWDDDNVDLLQESVNEIKQEMLKEIKNSNDPSLIMMKNMCKEAGYGMAYCYVAKNSGKKVWVKVGANEL